jgi:6-pyruvoyltetrahydropterin/6-carboxytetrahydropterin synthase
MTALIRVTKEFHFEMAHVLWNYDGPCRNVHGHSYRLFVTIQGNPLERPGDPKNGMVMDFTELKRIVKKEITSVFDHAVVLNSIYDKQRLDLLAGSFENVVPVEYQPTCENMVSDFALRIQKQLPSSVKLFSLKLYETATSYAEWFADDNK